MSKEISISEGTKAITSQQITSGGLFKTDSGVLHGRVVAICLSVKDPLYFITNTLESIQFEPVTDVTIDRKSGDTTKTYLIAYKHDPSIRTPVINEIVTLIPAPDINIQNVNTQYSKSYYYGNPISIYGAVEHNAAPDSNTLDNLQTTSFNNRLSSYNQAATGINNNTGATDTIVKENVLKLGNYFTEQGTKQLSPLEGDHKVEGRFGNSIRFGGAPSTDVSSNTLWSGPIGSPITIIRNGQRSAQTNEASVFEDINNDGGSIYFLSSQSIELTLACNNFDTYGTSNNNSQVASQIITTTVKSQPTGSSVSDDNSFNPSEVTTPPVSGSSLDGSEDVPSDDTNQIPDNEDDLNFVQIGEDIPVPLTQGVTLNNFSSGYVFTPGTNVSSTFNSSLVKAKKISLSTNNAINNYCGNVSSVPSITKNGKALLDLISITEGTIGTGNFNGYDLMVGGSLIPGFNSYTDSPQHPNIKIYIPDYSVYSTACGRYQFTIKTWNLIMGQGTSMSKFNQDYACWKNILNSANVPLVLIARMGNDQDSFNKVINMIASQWASLPVTSDPKGLYKQAGRFTFDQLYAYYTQILTKY